MIWVWHYMNISSRVELTEVVTDLDGYWRWCIWDMPRIETSYRTPRLGSNCRFWQFRKFLPSMRRHEAIWSTKSDDMRGAAYIPLSPGPFWAWLLNLSSKKVYIRHLWLPQLYSSSSVSHSALISSLLSQLVCSYSTPTSIFNLPKTISLLYFLQITSPVLRMQFNANTASLVILFCSGLLVNTAPLPSDGLITRQLPTVRSIGDADLSYRSTGQVKRQNRGGRGGAGAAAGVSYFLYPVHLENVWSNQAGAAGNRAGANGGARAGAAGAVSVPWCEVILY